MQVVSEESVPLGLYKHLVNNGKCRSVDFRINTEENLLVTAVKDINGVTKQITISMGDYRLIRKSRKSNAICACAYWSIMNGFMRMNISV